MFCPQAAASNASLHGTTPLGPIDLEFAYFSLYTGCVDCPYASDGALGFFAAPDGPLAAKADSLMITNDFGHDLALTLGGEQLKVYNQFENEVIVVFTDVQVPDVAQTNPPLDPDAPPTLSGKVSITGDGWDVAGEFTATLCRRFDYAVPCS